MKADIQKATQILVSEGATALITRSVHGIRARIRARLDMSAHAQLDRLASSNYSNAKKFEIIYEKKLWLRGMPHLNSDSSLSGHGSTLESTLAFRGELESFLIEINASKLVDAPCGDFNWMRSVNLPPGCEYIGGDIVSSLVASLESDHGRGATRLPRRFVHFDITNDDFGTADVWLCKDCFQHLSNSDIIRALENFLRSSVTYALITNHYGIDVNSDMRTGGFRHVDLTLPPFNLPAPVRRLKDISVDHEPKYVGVWRRQDIASAVGKRVF